MNTDKVQGRRAFIINTLYWVVVGALIFVCIKYVAVWVLPFIVGFCIAYLLKPLVELLHKKLKGSRRVWACLTVLLFYLLFAGVIWLIVWQLIQGFAQLFAVLPSFYTENVAPALEKANQFLIDTLGTLTPALADQVNNMFSSLINSLQSLVVSISKAVVSSVTSASSKLPKFLLGFVFAIMSSVFISMDYGRIRAFIFRQLPQRYAELLIDTRRYIFETLLKYVRAYAILMFITFVELSIGLTILRVENSVLVALLIALLDVLPLLGTGGIMIPWIAISAIQGDFTLAIGLTIVYVIITVIRNIIEPRIVGESIGLNPLLTLMAMCVGLSLFGFLGMLLAPMTLLILINFQKSGKIHLWK